jgi:hypothetical protein
MKFSHFSSDKTLTLDKLIFDYNKNIKYFKPPGLWFGLKNTWYNAFLIDMKKPNEKIYKYVADIDMKNIFILTEKNVKRFFTKYQFKISDFYVVNWEQFYIDHPKCKGIFLNFSPDGKYQFKMIKDFENIEPYLLWLAMWDISSLCLLDKSAIIDFKKVQFKN